MVTKFYIDKQGKYLGGFDGVDPPADAIEINVPPEDGRDKYVGGRWESGLSVTEKRKRVYDLELGDAGEQFDAIYKGMLYLVPKLVKAGTLTAAEAKELSPDKNQPRDTPAGWLGRVKDIKERFPKPQK